ncbi:zinc finger protein 384-like isoform X3 [Periophthalmus magnuspinnatus]|uniref:zinc finger protein 384-like isoform X3 n=1 Tax=Periophthalmus magnuspinnatus TaxID=409849 RepID=UPI0024371545|nr:zinc finger protein 384-like isoform X3 [Periophthalmus magnuspinnatus]
MEESHFNNSSYFWSPVTTVPGQVDKGGSFPPSSAPHYQPAVVTIPAPGAKLEGSNQPGRLPHHQTPHGAQNITVLPVSTTGIMTAAGLVITTPQGTLVSPNSPQSFVSGPPGATMVVSSLHATDTDKKVMPSPSKRGRKKKTTRIGPGGETIILAQLTPDGQVTPVEADPYDLSHDEDLPGPKDSTKTYRNHTESKPHKCPHCTKSFANSSYLAQHFRIHTGVKPYACTVCEKSFRQLSHLQQHNRIHTGDRPYKCTHPGCEKSFTQLSNLQSHRRQHNKDKPYKCANCNKGYVDAASLEVHMATHTVKHARIYSCGLCNRSYTSETYLVRHMEKHSADQLASAAAGQANQQNRGVREEGKPEEASPSRPVASGAGGGAQQGGQAPSSYQQTESVPCPFDIHQYKTVAASDIQYKPVNVSEITAHKDLCLTVSTSTIQVDHLNS